MNKQIRAHIGLFLANLIYGYNYIVAKEVMPRFVKPFAFIIMRVIGAFLLFLIVQQIWFREKIDRRDYGRIILCALFGVAVNQLFFFKGLSLTTPIHSAIIMTTNPIQVMLIASILIKEMITWKKIAGIFLGATGAITLIVFGKTISLSPDTPWGDFYIFINAMSYGVFIVLVKPLMQKYHPITVITWCFFVGIFMVLPFGIEQFSEINWSTMSQPILWGIAYVVIFATFLAYLLNTTALQTLSASVVSIYVYLQPILAVIIAIIYGKDSLSWLHIVCTLCIFTGVYLVSRSPEQIKSAKSE